ncbi:MAG: helix-turn-helix domain-containing protein [Bifidobacteriaceae bacterium]|nr:helix-turn-helix domain-containing protein [Bifidobacteriaceae bacterium]
MKGTELAGRRRAAGLTQQRLAELSGLKQSNLSAYETGRRVITEAVARRLEPFLQVTPSQALAANRRQILRVAAEHGAQDVRVFGSVARGEDTADSDLDLLVTMGPDATIFDLAELRELIAGIAGVAVDLVSAGGLLPRHRGILSQAVPV